MDWNALLNELFSTYLIPAVVTIVGAVASWIGVQLKRLYTEKDNTKEKQDVVQSTITYIQQVYGDLKGEEKLEKALDTASEWLTSKGITVSDSELRVLIESAVYNMKKGLESGTVLEVPEVQVLNESTSNTENVEENKTEEVE